MISIDQETISALKVAVDAMPDNVPLRKHLATLLLRNAEFAVAEEHFRRVLEALPEDLETKLGLAETFFQLEKVSEAMVIVEALLALSDVPAAAHLLATHIFLETGEVERASECYFSALEKDPDCYDANLEIRLEIDSDHAGLLEEESFGTLEAPEDIFNNDLNFDNSPIPQSSSFLMIEQPQSGFADLAGLEAAKQLLRMRLIHPFTHPEIYQAYGKSSTRGTLLYGPPGCGKTALARATAAELKIDFLTVHLSEIFDPMEADGDIHSLNELLDTLMDYLPCVVLFDDLEQLDVAHYHHHPLRIFLQAFITRLETITSETADLIVMAATSEPWNLDGFLKRSPCFEQVLFTPPPDVDERASMLQIMLKNKPLSDVDYREIARLTNGFSGDDLQFVVDAAVELKLQDALRQGAPAPLLTRDLLLAAENIRPTTGHWMDVAKKYVMDENRSGLYDPILPYLKL